jgi:hypothetical protein
MAGRWRSMMNLMEEKMENTKIGLTLELRLKMEVNVRPGI